MPDFCLYLPHYLSKKMESAGEISLKRELLMRATSLDLTLPSNVGRGRSLKSLVLAKTAGTSAPLTSRKILSQISFELLVGDSLSIIGKNGSGKSSLLRVLSGIFTPSSGLIDGKPKIVPLIELEGAFNGELTVSENITLLLIILGVPQERFNFIADLVLDFSELKEFASQQMRTLSTGMKARFAFALATSVPSDLILVDESLSVGDIVFSQKASSRITELQNQGKSIILVTHDLRLANKFTSKCLWLDEGKVVMYGNTKQVVKQYRKSLQH